PIDRRRRRTRAPRRSPSSAVSNPAGGLDATVGYHSSGPDAAGHVEAPSRGCAGGRSPRLPALPVLELLKQVLLFGRRHRTAATGLAAFVDKAREQLPQRIRIGRIGRL